MARGRCGFSAWARENCVIRRCLGCTSTRGSEGPKTGGRVGRSALVCGARDRDDRAAADGDLRVVDESGEDYLYPAARFVPIEVPAEVDRSMMAGV